MAVSVTLNRRDARSCHLRCLACAIQQHSTTLSTGFCCCGCAGRRNQHERESAGRRSDGVRGCHGTRLLQASNKATRRSARRRTRHSRGRAAGLGGRSCDCTIATYARATWHCVRTRTDRRAPQTDRQIGADRQADRQADRHTHTHTHTHTHGQTDRQIDRQTNR